MREAKGHRYRLGPDITPDRDDARGVKYRYWDPNTTNDHHRQVQYCKSARASELDFGFVLRQTENYLADTKLFVPCSHCAQNSCSQYHRYVFNYTVQYHNRAE